MRGSKRIRSPTIWTSTTRTDPKLIKYEELRRFHYGGAEPRRIVADPEDHIYIAGKSGLTVFSSEGAQSSVIDLATPARCAGIAADGTVYAGLEDHVEVFDRKGQRTATWEALGKKAWLSGMAIGENEVFVADSGNRVILRYDKSGKLVGRIGGKNPQRNVPGLILPSPYLDVQLGKDGLLRVNNTGRHCVEIYTANGDLELSWGKPTTAIEGFCGCCNPVGLDLLPDGRYVTCEKGLPRVKVYSADGTFECVVAGTESFPENWSRCSLADCTQGGLDVAVDSQSRVYVLDFVTGNVRVMKAKA